MYSINRLFDRAEKASRQTAEPGDRIPVLPYLSPQIQRMVSIWEKNSFLQFDFLLIGGGIVGLSTAYYLKKKHPQSSICILERGLLPSGASTKNAGFACMGSLTEILDDLRHTSSEDVLELFVLRKRGLERLEGILGREAMGFQSNGSHELLMKEDLDALVYVEEINELLRKELHTEAFRVCSEKISNFGFQGVEALIENCCEGEIDTGQMMKNLLLLVQSLGVEIKTGCEVLAFEEEANHVRVSCRNPLHEKAIDFFAKHLFICNNAFAKSLLPDADVTPGRGQVLITHPIPGLSFKGIFHFEQGYYYFREYQGCVLFGGGRNKDYQRETTTEFALNKGIQDDLEHKLQTIILPGKDIRINLQWSGIMAFGKTKRPILYPHSNRISVGVRMGGMGVAIGSEVGYQLSQFV